MLGDGYVIALVLQILAMPHCNVASFHVHLVLHGYLIWFCQLYCFPSPDLDSSPLPFDILDFAMLPSQRLDGNDDDDDETFLRCLKKPPSLG